MNNSGFINVLKPPGMTSHDVVSFIRRVYGLKKVGHAGTLDPAAAGVLPVAVGKATRLLEYFVEHDKRYRAELTLGIATDTGDDTGVVIDRRLPERPLEKGRIIATLAEFKGSIEQIPPMHSALKIDGKKLCDLARRGISVERKPRVIEIYDIELKHYRNDKMLFDVRCSKGTYIRTLCGDIGAKLRLPAMMSFLVRTAVGSFTLDSSRTLEEIKADPQGALRPVDTVVENMARIDLAAQEAAKFVSGQKLQLHSGAVGEYLVKVYNSCEAFIGVGQMTVDGKLIPRKIIARD